ncbi:hypothetical protein PV10_06210 [Exophiala mesophila]|uniref:Ubiquitin 3 binding protein But2 C-terminal domain-containing protein n=1 Tax=Exophiala mesophila TaxID=212818 RepID=A0A0D1XU23_EXOME|nr:uncharacterized protein PV10_06210 [Exophiala mesophila]KIV91696.1 hypothetical protein PV10_06210 [Exophiala mesophila]
MQYSAILVSLLAATGALAAPSSRRSVDNEIRVVLSDLGETGAQVTFKEGVRDVQVPALNGPFATLEVRLGKGVAQQDLRCQALDESGNPIVGVRGANVDITFADGGNGPWTFKKPSLVSKVICDPAFKKISPGALDVRVVLQNQATELGTQTVLASGVRVESSPQGSTGPYQTVELRVGELVDPSYRCKVLDNKGRAITLTRGANVDTTFGDGGNGPWTFDKTRSVSNIICDPTFVKAA